MPFFFTQFSRSRQRVVYLTAVVFGLFCNTIHAAPGTNVALAANGAVALASSTYSANYPVSAVNDGDRKGINWGAGGGWNDATPNAYGDWVEVDFSGSQTINEIDVFTVQDSYATPSTPTPSLQFSLYGITDFQVQYWTGTGWAIVPGGSVSGNRNVWRQFIFADVVTSKIRIVVNGALASYSRLVEIEAYQRVNVALASNGGVAVASSTYSSAYSAAGVNNGDRQGIRWGSGGGWNDATVDSYPDWVEIDFNANQTINEIDLFTIQDIYYSPAPPTPTMQFSLYGLTAFEIQYWNGLAWTDVPGGAVTGNLNVWRQFVFPNITTSKIRTLVNGSLGDYSRIAEIEAYQAGGYATPGPTPSPTPSPTPFPTPTPIPTQQVWIAMRTDGVSGSGAQSDPYDGSTQPKFDGIFTSYTGAAATYVTFHIGPGTFNAKGCWGGGWQMLDGWHIVGAGEDLTTIYQSGGTTAFRSQVLADSDGARTNMSVEDLTIDCAYFRLRGQYPNGTFAGVQLSGKSYIRNVRVKNWGGDTAESFALCVLAYGAPWADDAFIDNCEVLNGGGNATALTVASRGSLGPPWSPTPVYASHGSITNCHVDTANIGASLPGGCDGGQITGCTLTNCFYGVYSDTFPTKNVLVQNNVVSTATNGVYLNNVSASAVTIDGNTISATCGGVTFTNVTTNSVISNNRLIYLPGGNPMEIVLNKQGVNGITVSNNVLDLCSCIFFNTALNVGTHHNTIPTGELAIPDTF